MSYSTKLFGVIPYTLRESNKPIYNQQTIEKYLVEHYGSKEEAMQDVIEVFHDDKHCGNMVNIETKSESGTFWYPKCEGDTDEELENFMHDSDSVGLIFQVAYRYRQQDNIVKLTCKELGITYRELGEAIGYGENSVSNASRGEVSKAMETAIKLYVKNLELEKKLESSEKIKSILKEWLK